MMNRSFPPTSGIGNRELGIGSQNSPLLPLSPSPPPRKGVTLTEVLMALMVMGIGVVSVVTLFPVSLLRSIEATKLTNATLLKQNADARIEASAFRHITENAILRDPDRDGNIPNFDEHFGDNFVFDPLGAWIMGANGTITLADRTTPLLPLRTNANRGHDFYHATPFGDFNGDGKIAVGETPFKRFTFGVAENTPPVSVSRAIELAEEFVTLPDSFITIFEGIAGTFTYTAGPPPTITFTNPILGEYSAGQEVRLTVFNSGNQTSAVIRGVVTDADADTFGDAIALSSPIPATLAPVDRVVVDIPERRYTWIATVRAGNEESAGSTSIAVFFRRSFSPADEEVFILNERAGSYNVFEMPVGNLPGSFGNDDIQPDGLGGWKELPPSFERGGWMFDLDKFRWWKITEIQETATGFRFATDPGQIDDDVHRPIVHAIFPQNIVEVYTLKQD